MKQFITDDRRLEQFLFAHFIPFERQIKNERGLTAWVYIEGPRLFHVIAEYEASLIWRHGRNAAQSMKKLLQPPSKSCWLAAARHPRRMSPPHSIVLSANRIIRRTTKATR